MRRMRWLIRFLFKALVGFLGLSLGLVLLFIYPGIATWLPKAIGW